MSFFLKISKKMKKNISLPQITTFINKSFYRDNIDIKSTIKSDSHMQRTDQKETQARTSNTNNESAVKPSKTEVVS